MVAVRGSRAREGPTGRPRRCHGSSGSPCPLSFSIRSVMQKYLEDRGEVTFEKIFSQKLGEYNGASMDFPPLVQLPRPRLWGQRDPEAVFLPPPQLEPRRFGFPPTGARQPTSPWVAAGQ